MVYRHPFLANRVLEFSWPTGQVRSRRRALCNEGTARSTCRRRKCIINLPTFPVAPASPECEGPRKMRFPRGAACLALSKFKRRRCRDAPRRENTVGQRQHGKGTKAKSRTRKISSCLTERTQQPVTRRWWSISSCCWASTTVPAIVIHREKDRSFPHLS